MKPVTVIKRYANRKLYSTVTSEYVTIPEVLELSRTRDVLVIDNKTKRDITAWILAQGETQLLRGGETVRPAVASVPLFAPGIVGEILDAIVSNAARDRRQAGSK